VKKPSKKKGAAILLFLALVISMFPDVQSQSNFGEKPQPDYDIYNTMEDTQNEKNERINSAEVLNETQGRFDNITIESGEEKFDFTGGRETVTPDIPVPQMLGIYDAMLKHDIINNSEIIDWIFPRPAAYYIYTKYITNETITEVWTEALLRISIENPSRWWPVDVDADGTYDIEVFFDPELDYELGFIISEFWDRLFSGDPIEIPISLHYDIHRLENSSFDIPEFENLEVYVSKSLSYNNQNFLVFLGFNFTNVVTYFNSSVSISKVHLDNFGFTPSFPPSLNLNVADILALGGPYYARWNYPSNEDLSSFALEVATARVEFTEDPPPLDPYYFLNRSWVDIDFMGREPFYRVPSNAELMVDADDSLSSFDHITWNAQHECNAKIKFFDSQQNVTYAEIEIDKLVDEIEMSMRVEEKKGQNVTIIEYDAPGGIINYLDVHHYEFFDVEYENITKSKIDSGAIEYIHLFMNVSRIPKRLYLEGVFYLEEVESAPSITPGLGLVDEFVNSLVQRVISRFTRIAKTLSSIPYKLLSISEEGSFATIDTFGLDEIDKIEFAFISGDYITSYGNYIAFYNNTRPSNYPIAQISLSGRITSIRYFNASFDEDIKTEIEMMENQRLRALYIDDINSLYAIINISNVPGRITIFKALDNLVYDGAGSSIQELRFVSDYQGSYMDFRITDLADYVYVEYDDERTFLSTQSTADKIGELEFLVTTGPIFRLSGNHLLIRQEHNFSLLSGRIKDISELEYVTGSQGQLDIKFAQENVLNISLLENRSQLISADLIIDPMPRELSVDLSGLFISDLDGFSLPQLDTAGVLGFVHIIFSLAAMGNEILNAIDEATTSALNNIGNIISDLTFSYTTDFHTTLIGKVLRGDDFTLDDVDWMHGISVRQQGEGNDISMAAKLYLSGLPTSSAIRTQVFGDVIILNLDIVNFAPKHDWLCIDVKGLQERDVLLYLDEIRDGMDLILNVVLVARLNVIPQQAGGFITMESNEPIGSLYGRMRQTAPAISITEVFLSKVPSEMNTEFILAGNISINFTANRGIEYMFVKNTRPRDDEFHDVYVILHEVPKDLQLNMAPVTDYDMDASLLQTLPTLNITSSDGSLDAYIFADGKGMGQRGVFEIQVVNLAMEVSCEYKNGKYRIKSTGIDYLWLHAMDLPVMEGQNTRSIELVGKDILSFDIRVDSLFGNYPVIGIDNAKGGEVQLVIDHESGNSKLGLALIDFKTTGGMPSSPSILINGGSVDLDKGSSHVLIPAPILTLFLTLFS
jgi:hypothetical protein